MVNSIRSRTKIYWLGFLTKLYANTRPFHVWDSFFPPIHVLLSICFSVNTQYHTRIQVHGTINDSWIYMYIYSWAVTFIICCFRTLANLMLICLSRSTFVFFVSIRCWSVWRSILSACMSVYLIVNHWLFEHILLNRSEGNKNAEVIIKVRCRFHFALELQLPILFVCSNANVLAK